VFSLDQATNSIILQVNDLSAHFHSNDFSYTWAIFPVSGYVDVQMSNVQVTVGLQMTTQNLSGRLLPAIAVSKANMAIDTNNLSITMGGGFISDLVDLFTGLFKGTIASQIQSQVAS
jgi:hypothetical protein